MGYVHQGKPLQVQDELDQLKRLRETVENDQSYPIGFAVAGGLLTIARKY
jgi:hypothetical protein